MAVTHLFLKRTKGADLTAVDALRFSPDGIAGNVASGPLRQVLILPQSTLHQFGLRPGDLRENVVIDDPALHEISSGSVLLIGEARIRLTFHCEPCGRVIDKARASALLHKRGYLGQFLNAGTIAIGDHVDSLDALLEPVPYTTKERIRWALEKVTKPITASKLLFECGVPIGYARALPTYLKTFPPDLAAMVVFSNKRKPVAKKK